MSRRLSDHATEDKRSPGRRRGKAARAQRHGSGWTAELLDWAKTLAVAFVIVLLLHFFVFNLSTVKGSSMEPTLYEGEWLFVDKAVYLLEAPKRGDVVVLKDPAIGPEHKEFLVKRIIGLPGDKIEIRAGQLYRNGELIVEPYTDSDIEGTDYGPMTVQPDCFFVMGDNRKRGASRDSRFFDQPVHRDGIKGRADLILWPIAKINRLF